MPNSHMDRAYRLARQWSNYELRRIAPLFSGEVVNVSAGENIDKEGATYDKYFTNAKNFYLTNYNPGAFRGFQGRQNEYLLDLTQPPPSELMNRFDVVFNHTVLEHVFDIRTAFRSLCCLSKDIVIVIVPFAQIQHDTEGYKDYWRIAPNGLRELFAENRLEVIYEASNENNDAAVYLFFVGSRQPELWRSKMPSYRPVSSAAAWIGSLELLETASAKACVQQLGRIIVRAPQKALTRIASRARNG